MADDSAAAASAHFSLDLDISDDTQPSLLSATLLSAMLVSTLFSDDCRTGIDLEALDWLAARLASSLIINRRCVFL